MHSRTLLALGLLALSSALPGCSAVTVSGLQEAPANAAAPAATAPAVAPSTRSAGYDGITFSYSPGLAQDVQVASQPAVAGGPEAPYWQGNPAYLQFNFVGYVVAKTAHEPRLEIYPLAEYRAANPHASNTIDALQALLKGGAAQLKGKSVPADPDLPFLPIINARQSLAVGVKLIEFKNGTGVRYLTQYNQGPVPINNKQLIYTFQGLTANGSAYVSAILPVSNSLLGDDEQIPADADYIDKYAGTLALTARELDGAAPSDYTPDLNVLDAVIASLSVESK